MRLIVLSTLRRRVLGLVVVVPRLAARPCPRLKTPGLPGTDATDGDPGVIGDPGTDVLRVGQRRRQRLARVRIRGRRRAVNFETRRARPARRLKVPECAWVL